MSDQTTIEQLRNALMLAILTINCERRGLMPDGHVRARLVRVLNDSEPALSALSASGVGIDRPTGSVVMAHWEPCPLCRLRSDTTNVMMPCECCGGLGKKLVENLQAAGVDPSKDLATAFAEKFPQQDLPADAATVFRENYRALMNEEPPAGVDRQAPDERVLAMVTRCAAYVRGFYPPPPPEGPNTTWKTLQFVADMLEVQANALITQVAGVGVAQPPAQEAP